MDEGDVLDIVERTGCHEAALAQQALDLLDAALRQGHGTLLLILFEILGGEAGVEVDRQRRDQRLSFAGLHLRDHAAVEDYAAQELDIEMTLAEGALGRLAYRRKGVDEDVVERLARGEARFELSGAGAQLVIGHG